MPQVVRPIGPTGGWTLGLAAVIRVAVDPASAADGFAGGARLSGGPGARFARSGLDGSLRSGLEPYWSVKTTWGADAHFGPPAMRTGLPVHSLAQQRLAARLLGEAVAHERLGP